MQRLGKLGFLTDEGNRPKVLEAVFIAAFSALVFAFFFSFLGANDVIIGNDPAVHLSTAQNFLKVGRIHISDMAWYTPLYHLTLDAFIAFTGVTNIVDTMILLRAFTALVDWLVILSVYVVARKYFGKATGALAAGLMLLSLPFLELNAWGGYTTILSLAFIMLTILFLTRQEKGASYTLVAFAFAFSVVLSHQLATFLAAFIIPPFAIVILTKYRGTNSKVLIATLFGGAIAFLIYYLAPILPYLGELINILFFQLTVMQYQVPMVSFEAFLQYFGFILFFGFAGLAIAFSKLRKQKSLGFYLLLALTLLVPLFFSQSYLIGFNLSFPRFVDFLLPPLVVFAAVAFSFVIDVGLHSYSNNRAGWKRSALKVISITVVALMVATMVLRFQTVTAGAGEAAEYYSSSDVSACQAGVWIDQSLPDKSLGGVATQRPGNWMTDYTGRTVFAQTDPLVDWNRDAECVLALSYELENPLAMTRVYQAKANVSDETFLTINMVWHKAVSSTIDNSYLFYREPNGTLQSFSLASLNRSIAMDSLHDPKKIMVTYYGEAFKLEQIIASENDTYPVTITWRVSAVNRDLNYVVLLLNGYFNPAMEFNVAKVPGQLNWENPTDNPSSEALGQWAVVDFNETTLAADNEVLLYSNVTGAAYGVKFLSLPYAGSVLSLGNGVIDDLKWRYEAFKIDANYTVSYSYQVLAFSMSMYPQLEDPKNMGTLFSLKTVGIDWRYRNFPTIIQAYSIGFLVYDAEDFDSAVLGSQWLQLMYTTDKYFVLKVKAAHPSPYILSEPLEP